MEEGKHAAESGMDLKAYAERAGKGYRTLYDKLRAYSVLAVLHVQNTDLRDSWRNLAEIHAAPEWLWSGLVKAMVDALYGEGRNTVMGDEELEIMVREVDVDRYRALLLHKQR